MNIENYLSHRYPGEGKVLTVRNAIAGACNNFVKHRFSQISKPS